MLEESVVAVAEHCASSTTIPDSLLASARALVSQLAPAVFARLHAVPTLERAMKGSGVLEPDARGDLVHAQATTALRRALERGGVDPGWVGHVVMGNLIPTEPRDA